jgi:hypothetical protein
MNDQLMCAAYMQTLLKLKAQASFGLLMGDAVAER